MWCIVYISLPWCQREVSLWDTVLCPARVENLRKNWRLDNLRFWTGQRPRSDWNACLVPWRAWAANDTASSVSVLWNWVKTAHREPFHRLLRKLTVSSFLGKTFCLTAKSSSFVFTRLKVGGFFGHVGVIVVVPTLSPILTACKPLGRDADKHPFSLSLRSDQHGRKIAHAARRLQASVVYNRARSSGTDASSPNVAILPLMGHVWISTDTISILLCWNDVARHSLRKVRNFFLRSCFWWLQPFKLLFFSFEEGKHSISVKAARSLTHNVPWLAWSPPAHRLLWGAALTHRTSYSRHRCGTDPPHSCPTPTDNELSFKCDFCCHTYTCKGNKCDHVTPRWTGVSFVIFSKSEQVLILKMAKIELRVFPSRPQARDHFHLESVHFFSW